MSRLRMSITTRPRAPILAGVVLAGSVGLAACSGTTPSLTTSQVESALASAKAEAATVETFYGVAKGIAVAAEASPSVPAADKAAIATAVADADKVEVKVNAALAQATPDVAAIAGLVATLKASAVSVEDTSAPAVTVTPNAS